MVGPLGGFMGWAVWGFFSRSHGSAESRSSGQGGLEGGIGPGTHRPRAMVARELLLIPRRIPGGGGFGRGRWVQIKEPNSWSGDAVEPAPWGQIGKFFGWGKRGWPVRRNLGLEGRTVRFLAPGGDARGAGVPSWGGGGDGGRGRAVGLRGGKKTDPRIHPPVARLHGGRGGGVGGDGNGDCRLRLPPAVVRGDWWRYGFCIDDFTSQYHDGGRRQQRAARACHVEGRSRYLLSQHPQI